MVPEQPVPEFMETLLCGGDVAEFPARDEVRFLFRQPQFAKPAGLNFDMRFDRSPPRSHCVCVSAGTCEPPTQTLGPEPDGSPPPACASEMLLSRAAYAPPLSECKNVLCGCCRRSPIPLRSSPVLPGAGEPDRVRRAPPARLLRRFPELPERFLGRAGGRS